MFRNLGRRGIVLALFGLAWVIQGIGTFALRMPVPNPPSQVWHENLPYWLLASFWVTSGLLAIAFSIRPRRKNDTIGFLAVSAMPMLLATSYLVSFITWVVTWGRAGWGVGLLGFGIYGVLVVALGVIASWPEHPDYDTCPVLPGGTHE